MRWHMAEQPLPITDGEIPSPSLSWDELYSADFSEGTKEYFREATHKVYAEPEDHGFFHGAFENLEDVEQKLQERFESILDSSSLSNEVSLRHAITAAAYTSIVRFATVYRIDPPNRDPLLIFQLPTDQIAEQVRVLWEGLQNPDSNIRTACLIVPDAVKKAAAKNCFLPVEPSVEKRVETWEQGVEAVERRDTAKVWQYCVTRIGRYYNFRS